MSQNTKDVNSTSGQDQQRNFQVSAGRDYPIIKINSYILGVSEISHMEISIQDFLPHISLEIKTSTNSLTGVNMPKDGDLVSVFMRTPNPNLPTLRADFIIMKINISEVNYTKKVDRRYTKYFIQGDLYVPKMTSQVDQFAFCGTSKEAVIDFCQRFKLGFAYTDPENTKDKQVWLCYSNTPEEYIKSVVEHSWKDETSFFDCWIDQFYRLNFINVNDILGRKLTDDGNMAEGEMMSVLATQWIDGERLTNNTSEKRLGPKLFTNAVWMENQSWYITGYKPYNRSSQITLNEGTKLEAEFFLVNQALFDAMEVQDTSVLCEPAYNPEKLSTHIILRGRTGQSMDSMKQANNGDFVDIYRRCPWYGPQYVMSESDQKSEDKNNLKWSGNLHQNYYRAEAHNRINLVELNKMNIELFFDGLNFDIQRGEKIPVMLFDQNGVLSAKNRQNTALEKDQLVGLDMMLMYSGWFMIDSISYIYDPQEDPMLTNYRTVVKVTRREWITPEPTEGILTGSQVSGGGNSNEQNNISKEDMKKLEEQANKNTGDEETNLDEDNSTAHIKKLKSAGKLAEANRLSNTWESIEDMLKRAGITNYRVTSGYRPNNNIGKTGSSSNHTVQNFALDIVPTNGDWDGLAQQLSQSPIVQQYLSDRNFGILDEHDPRYNKYSTSSSGCYHFGPDSGALSCWKEWQSKYA